MSDERWRDTYDAWKLRSPDDERYRYCIDDDEPEECYHEDYEADILIGRATCNMCGHSWWQSREEIEREAERVRKYEKWQTRERRRERWQWLVNLCRWPLARKKTDLLIDDDIPF